VILNRRPMGPNSCSRRRNASSPMAGPKKTQDLSWREEPVEARLQHALVNGITDKFIIEDTEEARQRSSARCTSSKAH
jgi:5-methyltetrahydrofolate--homocysteine methyltransferase